MIVAISSEENSQPGIVKMEVVENLDRETVDKFASRHVSPASKIKSNGLKIYSNVKAFIISTFHGLDCRYLQVYLDEFCYRFNHRFWEAELFNRLLSTCVSARPVTLAELTTQP